MNNHLHGKALLTIFAVMTLIICFYPGNAKALTLSPTRFELKGDPGETISEEISLINERETAETFYSSFSNFEAQGESGSPAFADPKSGLGTWITTKENSISIEPGQQKIVPFEIKIPKDAEPGGHFAVIFWGTSPPGGTSGVSVGSKTGILVLLSV